MNSKIPDGYTTVIPYLIVVDAQKFIEFTQKVFHAVLINKHMRDEKIIQHAEIKIGNSVIMFADAAGDYKASGAGFFIYVDDADKTYNDALNNNAVAVTPLADQTYGRSGGVKDAFGNTWWITSPI